MAVICLLGGGGESYPCTVKTVRTPATASRRHATTPHTAAKNRPNEPTPVTVRSVAGQRKVLKTSVARLVRRVGGERSVLQTWLAGLGEAGEMSTARRRLPRQLAFEIAGAIQVNVRSAKRAEPTLGGNSAIVSTAFAPAGPTVKRLCERNQECCLGRLE